MLAGIGEFLGGWNPNDEEKEALAACLVLDAGLRNLIGNSESKWLPSHLSIDCQIRVWILSGRTLLYNV